MSLLFLLPLPDCSPPSRIWEMETEEEKITWLLHVGKQMDHQSHTSPKQPAKNVCKMA